MLTLVSKLYQHTRTAVAIRQLSKEAILPFLENVHGELESLQRRASECASRVDRWPTLAHSRSIAYPCERDGRISERGTNQKLR